MTDSTAGLAGKVYASDAMCLPQPSPSRSVGYLSSFRESAAARCTSTTSPQSPPEAIQTARPCGCAPATTRCWSPSLGASCAARGGAPTSTRLARVGRRASGASMQPEVQCTSRPQETRGELGLAGL
jgi:hypothetical protein